MGIRRLRGGRRLEQSMGLSLVGGGRWMYVLAETMRPCSLLFPLRAHAGSRATGDGRKDGDGSTNEGGLAMRCDVEKDARAQQRQEGRRRKKEWSRC